MLSIYKRVKAVFDIEYSKENEDFQRGFRLCLKFFEIGFMKTPVSTYALEHYQAREAFRSRMSRLKEKEHKIRQLIHSEMTDEEKMTALKTIYKPRKVKPLKSVTIEFPGEDAWKSDAA